MSFLQNFKFDLYGNSDSPKLVFLHGAMGAGANWRKIVNSFKDSYQILTYDQRGHGWSFKPAIGYGPEDYAEDLAQILDELKWDKIILVGHSMGGRNAIEFSHRFRDRVRALIVEDIGPEGNRAAMERTIHLFSLVPTPFQNQAAAKAFFAGPFLEKIGDHPQKHILGPYFYTNIEEKPDGKADWRFYKEGIVSSLKSGHFRPRWDQVRDLNCPTLFVRGENSEDFTQAEFEKLIKINPKVETVQIANVGHWIHFDKPLEFVAVIKDFLHRHDL